MVQCLFLHPAPPRAACLGRTIVCEGHMGCNRPCAQQSSVGCAVSCSLCFWKDTESDDLTPSNEQLTALRALLGNLLTPSQQSLGSRMCYHCPSSLAWYFSLTFLCELLVYDELPVPEVVQNGAKVGGVSVNEISPCLILGTKQGQLSGTRKKIQSNTIN